MESFVRVSRSWPGTVMLAVRGLRSWTARQSLVAACAAVVFGALLALATALVPNPFFARAIPPVWWNYPVWVLTSVFSGMLAATYAQGRGATRGWQSGRRNARRRPRRCRRPCHRRGAANEPVRPRRRPAGLVRGRLPGVQ